MQYPEDCQRHDDPRIRDLRFSIQRWRELAQINSAVNFGIAPKDPSASRRNTEGQIFPYEGNCGAVTKRQGKTWLEPHHSTIGLRVKCPENSSLLQPKHTISEQGNIDRELAALAGNRQVFIAPPACGLISSPKVACPPTNPILPDLERVWERQSSVARPAPWHPAPCLQLVQRAEG
ncbi:hypothetical protein E4K64_27810 [Bradyrhizobium frederickii]|uniref:Uncharacterized protein n=1 Tax=Bradyrhizobium frederickii TaxID=2560054 RepID=A0A4Y9NTE8_9BRAD|nr:hypothetical protein E4K64_27810 [Bradyrhizobium frederickii]